MLHINHITICYWLFVASSTHQTLKLEVVCTLVVVLVLVLVLVRLERTHRQLAVINEPGPKKAIDLFR